MSIIHVNKIKAQLNKLFDGLIDISDYETASKDHQENAFLTRGLASFVLMHLADISTNIAADAVTDATQDNGIDAIFNDVRSNTLYIVQTKWKHDGRGSIEVGDTLKFVNGVKDLLNANFERFNEKLQRKQEEIMSAITSAQTQIVLVVAYSGQDPLSTDTKPILDNFMNEMNDPTAVMQLRILKQGDIHTIIAQGTLGSPINLEIALKDWGQIREPYQAYYGRVEATEVAEWWTTYHPRLFNPNLRTHLGLTETNQNITDTLIKIPEHFWYFNNGITMLCGSIRKKPMNSGSHDTGFFECNDIGIVNGAQTVGAIANAFAKSPEKVAQATVMVRFISLDSCPPTFALEVTRATNTQNGIGNRDFVSLDPEQQRLKTELQIDGVNYVYKAGEQVQDRHKGCDLNDATVALACSIQDISYTVRAKNEIGKLWEDIAKPPYKTLFNSGLSGKKLWRTVQMLREIDAALNKRQRKGKDRLIAVHGNRFIAYEVIKRLEMGGIDRTTEEEFASQLNRIESIVSSVFTATAESVSRVYPESYAANIFKNTSKCQQLDKHISV